MLIRKTVLEPSTTIVGLGPETADPGSLVPLQPAAIKVAQTNNTPIVVRNLPVLSILGHSLHDERPIRAGRRDRDGLGGRLVPIEPGRAAAGKEAV
jgi:hypothetical protein